MQCLKLLFLMIPYLSGISGQHVHEPRFTVFDTPMTWSEAVDTCKQSNSFIANTHRDVSQMFLQKYPKRPYWIGKSLTPWVMLRGCVEWKRHADKTAIYKSSKYNQMSECAAACLGSVSFLLQRDSCNCLDEEENTTVTIVPYKTCNVTCPGLSNDKCGGRNVFTYYEYYHGDIMGDNEMYNCVCKEKMYLRQCNCDLDRGFTCEMSNGSKVSYKKDVPRTNISLSYTKAVKFCSNLSGGLRISPMPVFNLPYLGHKYWTTVTRATDWNYDTVSQRRPEFGCVAMLDENGRYIEEYKEVSEKYGFVCQYDDVAYETYLESDVGNITTPNYPRPYKHNLLYIWHIGLNRSTEIELVFEDINLEDSTGCVYDYILVMENNRSREKLCGEYKEKRITTRGNSVTVVFRSDNSIAGNGFRLLWSPVNSEHGPKSSHQRSFSGGAVVGITVVAAVIFVVVASFIACFVYRKTHKTRSDSNLEETSNAHNLVYAISSFNTGSEVSSENAYLTVLHTDDKQMLRKETSYANDPKKAKFPKVTEDDKDYLNAGLASDIRAPPYDDIDSSQHYTQVDKSKKYTKKANNDENEYIEIANI